MRFSGLGLFALFIIQNFAWAQICPMVGQLSYNTSSHRMEICDLSFATRTVTGTQDPATCTGAQEGRQQVNSGYMQYCDGSYWRTMAGCQLNASTPCNNGKIYFSAKGRLLVCGGGKWNIAYSNGNCLGQEANLDCIEYTDATSCTAATCNWVGNSCQQQAAGCASYTTAVSCNADSNCGWNAGVCDDAF